MVMREPLFYKKLRMTRFCAQFSTACKRQNIQFTYPWHTVYIH